MNQDMLNENQDNINWKNKLEQAESLSGEILADKKATWEKLHSRLQPKPRRTRAAWYWAAAGCIFITLMMPLLTVNKKQQVIIKNEIHPFLSRNEFVKTTAPVQGQKMTTMVAAAIEKGKIVTHYLQLKKQELAANDSVQKLRSILPGLDEKSDSPLLKTVAQVPVQEITTAVAIALLGNSKKINVVHINELGDPVPEVHSRFRIADYRSIQIRLINQQVYSNASTEINNPGFNIFKTTNAPSN